MAPAETYIVVGTLTSAHGVKGQMKLTSYMEEPEAIFALTTLTSHDGSKRFHIQKHGYAKQQFVVSIDGSTSRNDTEFFRGMKLYTPKSALPTLGDGDAFYIEALEGLDVRTPEGDTIGLVKAVHNFGAGDIVEIAPHDGTSAFMVTFTHANFPKIALAEGYLTFEAPEILAPSTKDS